MGGPPGRGEILNKRRLSGRFGAIRLIPGGNGGTYPHCNSVWIEEAGVLIDPASDRGRLEELRRLGAVKAVWLSHGHEDHFADLDLFDDCPLWVSREEAPPLESLEGLLDAYGIGEPDHRAYWRRVFEERFHFRPRSPSRFFRDGEVIDLGSETVQVIVTPGHTPGHAAFLFRKTGALFLGDYDLTPFGPWYGDAGSSIEETLRSIERLRGIDAPELVSADGKKAKEFLEKKLGLAEGEGLSDRMVLVRTEKSDKYDRYLADLFYTDKNGREIYLNQEILAAGLAIRMGE